MHACCLCARVTAVHCSLLHAQSAWTLNGTTSRRVGTTRLNVVGGFDVDDGSLSALSYGANRVWTATTAVQTQQTGSLITIGPTVLRFWYACG